MSSVELLHRHLGAPHVEECEPLSEQARCWLCGGAAVRGRKVAKWVGPAFTSQNRVRNPTSKVICEGCVFICGRLSPVPGRPPAEGKTSGGNWRNYSHWMWEVDGEWKYDNASKGEKHKLRAFLAMSKPGRWWMAIADSGQKHVIPWAPINGNGDGRVAMDDDVVLVAGIMRLVDFMSTLLTAGATKDELLSGEWTARAWSLLGERIEAFEEVWAYSRGSKYFGLAVWLAQRDEAAVQARLEEEKRARATKRSRPAARGDGADGGHVVARSEEAASAPALEAGGTGGGGAPAVPEQRREAAQPLGRHRRAAQARPADDGDARGAGGAVAARPAHPDPGQLSLFGSL
jgi:hypothetical protein